MILDPQLPFIYPDGDALPGEAIFRIEVEALHTDKAIAIDGTEKLPGLSKELPTQTLELDDTPRSQPRTSTGVRCPSARVR